SASPSPPSGRSRRHAPSSSRRWRSTPPTRTRARTSRASQCRRRRRGRENSQHEEPALAGVPDAVRHPLRRDQEITGLHRQPATVEQEYTVSLNYLVNLVHVGVGVQGVGLSWLERVQPHQDARRLEERALPHLVAAVLGMLSRADDTWMLHEARPPS